MLKDIRNKIKELKAEDREAANKRIQDIGKDGRLVMEVKLKSAADAYSEFSPEKAKRLNPALESYILSENNNLPNPVHIKVYGGALAARPEEQQEFTKTLLGHFTDMRHKQYNALRLNMLISLWCLIVGLAIIGLSAAFRFLSDYLEIIYVSIEIMAWVFMWEAFYSWFLARPDVKLKYYRIAKISQATIEFCTEE